MGKHALTVPKSIRRAMTYVRKGIIRRCYQPAHPSYPRYGGKGITVCEEWVRNPKAFIEWAYAAGFKRGLQVDRVDNDGPYSPENCRFVTNRQNNLRKKRTGVFGRGVERHFNKYRARAKRDGTQITIGVADTAEEAAELYREWVKKNFGFEPGD